MRRDNLQRALYNAAMTFRIVGPRLPLASSDFVVFRLPYTVEPFPVAVSLSEPLSRDRERGLVIVRGSVALAQMMTITSGARSIESSLDELDLITCTFARFSELVESAKHLLRRAGTNPRANAVVPQFLAKPANEPGRAITIAESRTSFLVIRGLLMAAERGWLGPRGLLHKDGAAPALLVDGDLLSPSLSVTLDLSRGADRGEDSPLFGLSHRELRALPRHRQSWLVGCPMVPLDMAGTDNVSRLLLVIDRKTNAILQGAPVSGPRWEYAAASLVLDLMKGNASTESRGLPDQLLFTERGLADLLCPELRMLSISCRYEPRAEGPITSCLDQVITWLDDHLSGNNKVRR